MQFRRVMSVRGAWGRRSLEGLTLIEVVVAMTLLAVAVVGYARTIAVASVATTTSRESTLAANAAKRMVATLRALPFDEVFRRYNATTVDDPFGVVSPGDGFAVEGLDAAPDDPDGLPGEILFPTALVGGALLLREDVVDPKLGMPSDLNGGGIDGLDHALDYQRLPFLVRVRWRGVGGVGQVEYQTVLGSY